MKVYRFFALLSAFLWAFNGIASPLLAQNTNTYLGPNEKIPGDPQRVRVQILIYNDPEPNGVQVISASFDHEKIPLKPRDVHGYRGQASFQKKPGTYKLFWKVNRDHQTWPRTIEHEAEVIVSPRDLWIQVAIIGNEAEIS